MYLQENPEDPEGNEVYRYHLSNFGHPSEFGFKDFCLFGLEVIGIRTPSPNSFLSAELSTWYP